MKRALLAIAATIAGLYATLTYKPAPFTPAVRQTSSTTDETVNESSTQAVETVDGPLVTMLYGPVEVEISIRGSRVVGVRPVELPSGNARSQTIEARAVPILETETLNAQTAEDVATVSGATFTSGAWRQSLQGALVQGGLEEDQ